jgi:hypothetical protein
MWRIAFQQRLLCRSRDVLKPVMQGVVRRLVVQKPVMKAVVRRLVVLEARYAGVVRTPVVWRARYGQPSPVRCVVPDRSPLCRA